MGLLIQVHEGFLCHKLVVGFFMVFIRYTAVYGTNFGTLWLFMEADTFRAFVRYNVINVVINRFLCFICIVFVAVWRNNLSAQVSPLVESPLHGTFINSIIWALRLACAAVDTFVCDFNGHFYA